MEWVKGKNELAECHTNAAASSNKLIDILEKSPSSALKCQSKENEFK